MVVFQYLALLVFHLAFVLLTVGLGVIPLVEHLTAVDMPFWPTMLTAWLVAYIIGRTVATAVAAPKPDKAVAK